MLYVISLVGITFFNAWYKNIDILMPTYVTIIIEHDTKGLFLFQYT